MPRYIDADELKESLKNLKAKANNKKYEQGLQDAIDGYFPQIIDDAPTADVQPVKHGRWIECAEQKHIEKDYECSECGYRVCGEYECTSFCGGCGAIMGGDSNADLWVDDESVPNKDMRPDNEVM